MGDVRGAEGPILEALEPRTLLSANVFELHSNPGAPVALYLDFDGHYESRWGSWTNVTLPAYSLDANPGFSQAELDVIRKVWETVAEDYAPFDIDVTTEEPDRIANRVALRVAIGGKDFREGGRAFGIAYTTAFQNSLPDTAYVFADGNSNDRRIGRAATHEAGHILGLHHQSDWEGNTLVREYSRGPLMGLQLDTISRWTVGRNDDGDIQDDMAVLASGINGFGYRADEAGQTASAAKRINLGASGWSFDAVIARNGDADWYRFNLSDGEIDLNVKTTGRDSNLSLSAGLYDSSGRLVLAANSSGDIAGRVDAGVYYLRVHGGSAYGSVGQYAASGSFDADAGSPPPSPEPDDPPPPAPVDPPAPEPNDPSPPGKPGQTIVVAKKKQAFAYTDRDGDTVSISVSGSGTAKVTVNGDGSIAAIEISGTKKRSKVKVAASGGNGSVDVDRITTDGALGKFFGGAIRLRGDADFAGGLKKLVLGSADPERGRGSATVSAPRIAELIVNGKFWADLDLHGGSKKALKKAAIAGSVYGSTWTIDRSAGRINVGSTNSTFVLDVVGSVDRLAATGDLRGRIDESVKKVSAEGAFDVVRIV